MYRQDKPKPALFIPYKQRQNSLRINNMNHSDLTNKTPDRIIREAERKFITSISRAQAYQLEKQGRFPKRIHLGSRSVGWRLSDIMTWMNDRFMAA